MTATAGNLAARAALAFAAYRDGDRERMGELVDVLTPILWHTARSQRLDQQGAEDVIQIAWIRLVENADSINDPQAVLAWLLTTVRREAWRLLKRDGRALPVDDIPEPDPDDAPTQLDPAVAAVLREEQTQLWQHIALLPQRCQALLRIIAFVDRPDYAAVSESLNMPVGSIGPTRGRCLAKLRTALLADPTWS
ncbi:MAG: sigma-70 family RNA polymerase sigma factor [Dermatophilaceae bacterium]